MNRLNIASGTLGYVKSSPRFVRRRTHRRVCRAQKLVNFPADCPWKNALLMDLVMLSLFTIAFDEGALSAKHAGSVDDPGLPRHDVVSTIRPTERSTVCGPFGDFGP